MMLMFYVSLKHVFPLTLLIAFLMFMILMFLGVTMVVVPECVFVKDTFTSNVVKLDIDRPASVEDAWVAVQCCKLPAVIIGCVYRHPKAPAVPFDYIEDVLRLVSTLHVSLIVLETGPTY